DKARRIAPHRSYKGPRVQTAVSHLHDSLLVTQTVDKYLKTVKDINTKYNLAYNNSTCHTVSKHLRSILLKKSEP
ncbi:MAG: hypothetical protein ACKPKO_62620, partial [Candidatus Fonsibacter sp.]